jgi:hypothetical protein
MGGVATTTGSPGSPPSLTCEFLITNATGTSIVIVNIGAGETAESFAILRSLSSGGGMTTTSIEGLGSSAFSVSMNGEPQEVFVLTAQGLVYSVGSSLPFAQDEALILQLIKVP